MQQPKYQRVLIKMSGESLAGGQGESVDPERLDFYADEIGRILHYNVQVAVVIGGGNLWRGHRAIARGMEAAQSHYMGMLATIINALAMQDALERRGIYTRAMTAIKMDEVAEPYIRRRAVRHMEKGRVVILAAGTGNPFFTTDSAAALRATEIRAEVILMAKNGVDGVYTADPRRDPSATRLERLTYMDALNRGLTVMDSTALTFCMDNQMPIIVFNALQSRAIERIILGEEVGSLVSHER
jgi:uridylate kinase